MNGRTKNGGAPLSCIARMLYCTPGDVTIAGIRGGLYVCTFIVTFKPLHTRPWSTL